MLDEKILSILRTSRDGYVSGEELCKLADISRAAIWKHIEKLRAEGYEIDASPHLGYRLVKAPDALISSEIRWRMKTRMLGRQIMSFKKVDSTNDVAYGLAEKGMKEGAVIISEEQAKGKGRQGRLWISPPSGGIYMSCILRPEMSPREIPKITLVAAVAVATAIRDLTGLDAVIKWPNDILINGNKICGILTEMKAEQDGIDFVIVGIGVNVNTAGRLLPKGASSIREEGRRTGLATVSRVDMARRILEKLEENYILLKTKGFKPIIEEWKNLSSMIGARIKVIQQNRTLEGQVHDIDSDGALIVRLGSGVLERISSGDVVAL